MERNGRSDLRHVKKISMFSEDTKQKSKILSTINLKSISSESNYQTEQRKAYKRKRAKIKRSKSHVYKQDPVAVKDNLENYDDGGSSGEDIEKLKERVQMKGITHRKVIMVDWDKTPFVFSDRGNRTQFDRNRAPRLVKCKQIDTIVEAEERDSTVATPTEKGRSSRKYTVARQSFLCVK